MKTREVGKTGFAGKSLRLRQWEREEKARPWSWVGVQPVDFPKDRPRHTGGLNLQICRRVLSLYLALLLRDRPGNRSLRHRSLTSFLNRDNPAVVCADGRLWDWRNDGVLRGGCFSGFLNCRWHDEMFLREWDV